MFSQVTEVDATFRTNHDIPEAAFGTREEGAFDVALATLTGEQRKYNVLAYQYPW